MNWQFWNRKAKEKEKEENFRMEQLQKDVVAIHTEMKDVTDQVTKMRRIQFKSGKNVDEKLDEIGSVIAAINRQNELVTHYERQQDQQMQQMMRLLDDLDHVSSGIKETDQVWHELLSQWSRSVMESLEGIGVYQLDILGKTFNPEVAESVKTVVKDTLSTPPTAPYQVVEVLNRGYITENSRLIRKAKVVTVKEEDFDAK